CPAVPDILPGQEEVEVDAPGPLVPRPHPPHRPLHGQARIEDLLRRKVRLDLQHLVDKLILINDFNRGREVESRLQEGPQSSGLEASEGALEGARPIPLVRAETNVDPTWRHARAPNVR